jgi:hypothetical protein
MKIFKSKRLKLIFVFFIIQSLQLTPAQAISCNDAKKTANTINSKIIALEKEHKFNLNKITSLQKSRVITKKEADLYTSTCLKMSKNPRPTASDKKYCDSSNLIGQTKWECTTKACNDLLTRDFYIIKEIPNLKYDASKVITNSQKCFSAIEVLNAQKELQSQGRS